MVDWCTGNTVQSGGDRWYPIRLSRSCTTRDDGGVVRSAVVDKTVLKEVRRSVNY